MVATVAAMLGVEISESTGMRPGFPVNSPKALFDEGGGKSDTAIRPKRCLTKAAAKATRRFAFLPSTRRARLLN